MSKRFKQKLFELMSNFASFWKGKINQFDNMIRIRISKIKKNTGPVMHPNLCVCFHSAVTFWLNDRLTVCWKAVNWLFCKSLPSLTKCLPGKMSPFDWVGFLCLTLLARGKRKVFLGGDIFLGVILLVKLLLLAHSSVYLVFFVTVLYILYINPSAVCFLWIRVDKHFCQIKSFA